MAMTALFVSHPVFGEGGGGAIVGDAKSVCDVGDDVGGARSGGGGLGVGAFQRGGRGYGGALDGDAVDGFAAERLQILDGVWEGDILVVVVKVVMVVVVAAAVAVTGPVPAISPGARAATARLVSHQKDAARRHGSMRVREGLFPCSEVFAEAERSEACGLRAGDSSSRET